MILGLPLETVLAVSGAFVTFTVLLFLWGLNFKEAGC